MGFAILDLLPGNGTSATVVGQLNTNSTMVPAWLAGFDHSLSNGIHSLGAGFTVLVVAIEMAVGLGALTKGRSRIVSIALGIALAGVYWAAGQNFGQLFGGQATDPSTGPLLMFLGVAALGVEGGFDSFTPREWFRLRGDLSARLSTIA
jgi:hypothetical protein